MAEALASLREVGDVSCHPKSWPAVWLAHDWVLGLACWGATSGAQWQRSRPGAKPALNSSVAQHVSSFLTINPGEVDAAGRIHRMGHRVGSAAFEKFQNN